MLSLSANIRSESCTVIRTEGIAKDLNIAPIMKAWYRLHQMRSRVVPKIGRDVPNSDSPPVQTFAKRVLHLMKNGYLKGKIDN